jgi:hypothetical protein
LLPVLLAEHGGGGGDEIEEPADDLADALEMTGAVRVLEALAHRLIGQRRDRDGGVGGVDRIDRRRVDDRRPRVRAACGVVLEVPRVPLVVLRVVELGGIHEDGHDAARAESVPRGVGGREADQIEVPAVQGAHRGHQHARSRLEIDGL